MNNESLVTKHIEITHMELLIKQNFVLTIFILLMLSRKIVPISPKHTHKQSRHASDSMRQPSVKSQIACHMWYCYWNIDYIKIQVISRKTTIQTKFIEPHLVWVCFDPSLFLGAHFQCTFRTTMEIKYGFPQINLMQKCAMLDHFSCTLYWLDDYGNNISLFFFFLIEQWILFPVHISNSFHQ